MNFSIITTLLAVFASVATSYNAPHHENYFSTIVPAEITRTMENTKICLYNKRDVVCNGFKADLRVNLLSPRVATLSLKNNDLDELDPRVMRRLMNLEFLDVRGNLIVSLRRALQRNKKLRWLLLDNNRIGEETRYSGVLRQAFLKNIKLEMITLRNNGIRKLSTSIIDPANNKVSYFDASENQLERISRDTFADFTQLKTLDLHTNMIKYVNSAAFTQNVNLEVLDMCDNLIAFVGGNSKLDLRRNTRLTKLKLSSNKLGGLDELDLSENSALEHLDLSYNRLRQIGPLAFVKNSELLYLNLSYNHIQTIHPNAFVGLKNLHSLDLSHNRISFLSRNVFVNIRNLQVFSLAYNLLSQLPEDTFYGNGRLVALSLRGNNLRSWQPATIHSNYLLRYLDLRNNELTIDNVNYFTERVDNSNRFDIGDWASASHVGMGEDDATNRKHRMLNNRKVFDRLTCLRLSGNPLATQARQAAEAQRIHFGAGKTSCLVTSSADDVTFRCGCTAKQLAFSLDQWVKHTALNIH